jgi:tetratricopeptide (TPR) repeat protein
MVSSRKSTIACRLSDRHRSRIAVLPFAGSGSEKTENLAFALAQEITTALGRSCRFDVIAGMTTASAVESCVREHQFRRMNLDYLVDLAVAEKGHSTEINIRLLDLDGDARPIWSKRLNPTNYGVRQIGDLVAHIVNRLDPAAVAIEDTLTKRYRYGATGFLRRAVPLMFSIEREKYRQAGQLIKFALEIEPDDGEIAAWAARWQHFNIILGYAEHSMLEQAKVRDLALRALRSNPDNADALGIYAHCCAFLDKKFDTALHYFDRSLSINSSLAFIWGLSSPTYCYIGEPKTALERLDHHSELAPFDPYICYYEYVYAIAYVFNQDYERATSVGRRAVEGLPEFVNGYKPLIAALGHLGRREEAKPYLDKLLTLEPGFTVERFAEVYPFKKAADRRRYMEGLRLAGVAER